jgi:glutamate formiminotransferase
MLKRRSRFETAVRPDIGGPELHPTAGACAVGARRILIACNINFQRASVAIVKDIARTIRASSGGFAYVKALGLELPGRGLAQVSMNLTYFEETPLALVFERVRELGVAAGATVHSTEIIGFPPRAALIGAEEFLALCEGWTKERILENRIGELIHR